MVGSQPQSRGLGGPGSSEFDTLCPPLLLLVSLLLVLMLVLVPLLLPRNLLLVLLDAL